MLQARGEAAGETLPVFAAVFAAINFSLRTRPGSCFAPLSGVMFGSGDEHEIGIFWIPSEAVGINIGRPIGARPTLPGAAARVSDVKAGAAGDVDSFRIAGINQTSMHVVEMLHRSILVGEQANGIQLRPTFAIVGTFQERALFDAGVNGFGLMGVESDELRVGDMWGRGKGPL